MADEEMNLGTSDFEMDLSSIPSPRQAHTIQAPPEAISHILSSEHKCYSNPAGTPTS